MSREFIGRLWSDPQVGARVPSQRVRLETSKINEWTHVSPWLSSLHPRKMTGFMPWSIREKGWPQNRRRVWDQRRPEEPSSHLPLPSRFTEGWRTRGASQRNRMGLHANFTQSSRTQEPSDSIWVIQSCPVYRQQVLHTTKCLPAPSLLVLSTVCGRHMFSRVATGIKKPSLLRTAYTNSQTDHFSFFFFFLCKSSRCFPCRMGFSQGRLGATSQCSKNRFGKGPQ